MPGGECRNQAGDRQDATEQRANAAPAAVKWPPSLPPPHSRPHTDPEEPRWEWEAVREDEREGRRGLREGLTFPAGPDERMPSPGS